LQHIGLVKNMVYCSNCGSKIDDEAYFCPKCGTKTQKGKAAKAAYPSDELQDAFYRVGVELERAFTMAAHETHQAILKAKDNFEGKTTTTTKTSTANSAQNEITCPKCGTKNAYGAIFCNNCGTRLSPAEESHGST
jgi:predicted amidophosphoribosyltransferase